MEVILDTQIIPKSGSFMYLGSMIQGIGSGWMKQRFASGACLIRMCRKNLKVSSIEWLIDRLYLYEVECWPVKYSHVQKMKVAKMRLLRQMCEHTSRDKIKNEDIRDKVRVASMMDKMQEARLRRFEHVKTRCSDALVRRCERLNMIGLRRQVEACQRSIVEKSDKAGNSTYAAYQ